MARVAVAGQRPKGPHPGAVAAGALDLVWTAADVANKHQLTATGRDILLVWNTDASAHNFTLTSVADKQNRTGDVTNYSLAAGKVAAYKFDDLTGWAQADGSIYFEADNALVKFAVISVP
jgi:hypothetical protein